MNLSVRKFFPESLTKFAQKEINGLIGIQEVIWGSGFNGPSSKNAWLEFLR